MKGTLKKTFQSPYHEYERYNGKTFEIIKELHPAIDNDQPTYLIKFPDGVEIDVWDEEIFETTGTGTIGDPIKVLEVGE